jgi:hypothetical protein
MSDSLELNTENASEISARLKKIDSSFEGPIAFAVALNQTVDLADRMIKLSFNIKSNNTALVSSKLSSITEVKSSCFFLMCVSKPQNKLLIKVFFRKFSRVV